MKSDQTYIRKTHVEQTHFITQLPKIIDPNITYRKYRAYCSNFFGAFMIAQEQVKRKADLFYATIDQKEVLMISVVWFRRDLWTEDNRLWLMASQFYVFFTSTLTSCGSQQLADRGVDLHLLSGDLVTAFSDLPDWTAVCFMASSQFFSQRKTIKPPAMLVADKAFSFHLLFLYNLIVQAK